MTCPTCGIVRRDFSSRPVPPSQEVCVDTPQDMYSDLQKVVQAMPSHIVKAKDREFTPFL